MSRARVLLLALAGLALPAVLAAGVYVASAQSLDAAPTIIQAPPTIAQGTGTETAPATTTEPTQTDTRPTTTSDDDDRDDDLPGKCKDPEHQLDPDCDPRTADDDDSSGPGSGGSGGDDSSGPGSGGSDDDSSGHGSGDDD